MLEGEHPFEDVAREAGLLLADHLVAVHPYIYTSMLGMHVRMVKGNGFYFHRNVLCIQKYP